jgi:drug/metabolite transporter (DMT)-like permease
MLNFEGVATTLLAALIFKEAVGKRTIFAVILITLASVLLTWNSAANWEFSVFCGVWITISPGISPQRIPW